MSSHKRNTQGLKENAAKRKADTIKKVDDAIQRLLKNKDKINFNSVSEEANVSKSYLYNNKDIRQRIESLREQQKGLPFPRQVKREMTDASKDVVIAAKNKRIKELETENKRLREELKRLRGQQYDQLR